MKSIDPKDNPVRVAALGTLAAGTGLLVAFGVDLTTEQTVALSVFGAAVLGLFEAVRAKVTPTRRRRGA